MKKPFSTGKNYIQFSNVTLYFYQDKRVLSSLQYRKLCHLLQKTLPGIKRLLNSSHFPTRSQFAKADLISINLSFCGLQKIRQLNKTYRQKDKVTDVLSFPGYEDLRKAKYQDFIHSEIDLGDIVICAKQALKQASDHNIDFYSEAVHLFIHGLLHLLGFDHELSLKEEKLMERLEQKMIKELKKPS